MRVRVKICGLNSREGVEAAVAAGADAVGFVFADSPRRVDPDRAGLLARGSPSSVARVAVFRHPPADLVRRVLSRLAPDWIQADAEDVARLDLPPDLRILPVFRDGPGVEASLRSYLAGCRRRRPRLLLEARRSGRGERPDWDLAAAWSRRARLVLAGGLTPGSVAPALARVRPYAVDVSSGVESEPGVKDPLLIAEFVRAVRREEGADRPDPRGETR